MKVVNTQWLYGVFSNWQIFLNDPGYANTNSNLESFNSTFKRDYTKHFKCSIITSCNKIFECIIEYSTSADNIFHLVPRFDKSIRERALSIDPKSKAKKALFNE